MRHSGIFKKGEISRPQSYHGKAIQEMRLKLSLEELMCGELTLQTEEKYEIIRLEINRIIWGSSNMPLPCEVDGLSRMVRGNRWDGKLCVRLRKCGFISM